MRRSHSSPLLAAALFTLLGSGFAARADDEVVVPPRVIALQDPGGAEKAPPPRVLPAAFKEPAPAVKEAPKAEAPKNVPPPDSKEEPKGAPKEEPKEAADAAKDAPKEDPKTSPLDEVKKSVDDLKDAVADAKLKGDSAWMLTASAFVMLMLPGLALFYGGMVRRKNVLATMMQSMGALAVVGLYWVVIGYSLAFGPSLIKVGEAGGIIGWSPDLFFLKGINADTKLAGNNITVYAHVMFQGMFAIITPALISGAVAERIRFWPFMIFMILWVTIVYCPLAHMVWAYDWFTPVPEDWSKGLGGSPIGLLGKLGALDFAGGTVVHIAAGMAGLAGALVLRKRIGYPEHAMHPNSMVLTLLGAGLLWFGWFGFNGGSATASSGLSTSAFAATQVAAAAAGLSWIFVEWLVKGKPTALGLASGIVAGLVAVTPASGFVYIWGAVMIGIAAGVVCYFAVSLKSLFGYDDSLDAFGVHAVGGFLGAVLTGVFCSVLVNSTGANGPFAMSWQKARVAELPKLIQDAKLESGKYDEELKHAQDKVTELEGKSVTGDDLEKAKKDAADAQSKSDFYKGKFTDLEAEKKKIDEMVAKDTKDEKGPLSQFIIQLKAAGLSVVFAFVFSMMLFVGVQALSGGNFTTDVESETEGLDRTEHGEVGFDYGPGLDTTPAMATEPRAAKAPPGSEKRFVVVIEGTENGVLMKAWSDLCKPKDGGVVDPDFKAVYPYVTTVQGNKFRLRGGDPKKIAAHLQNLFQKVLGKQSLKVSVVE